MRTLTKLWIVCLLVIQAGITYIQYHRQVTLKRLLSTEPEIANSYVDPTWPCWLGFGTFAFPYCSMRQAFENSPKNLVEQNYTNRWHSLGTHEN